MTGLFYHLPKNKLEYFVVRSASGIWVLSHHNSQCRSMSQSAVNINLWWLPISFPDITQLNSWTNGSQVTCLKMFLYLQYYHKKDKHYGKVLKLLVFLLFSIFFPLYFTRQYAYWTAYNIFLIFFHFTLLHLCWCQRKI